MRGMLVTATALAFTAIIGTIAVRQIQEAVRLANVRVAAYRIENGLPIGVGQLRNARDATKVAAELANCNSSTIGSMVVVALFEAGITNQVQNYQAWLEAHQDAKAVVARARHCLPLSGNLVLRDTLLNVAIAEDPEMIYRKMALAQFLAPFEEAQVIARLRLWKSLSQPALQRSAQLARRDIATLLYRADRNKKSVLYDKPSPTFQALVLATNLEMRGQRENISTIPEIPHGPNRSLSP